MMAALLTLTSAWAMSVLGVVVWAVRQEGRINAHDQLFIERETLMDERHQDLQSRLTRIEVKLDMLRLNGGK